MVVNSCPSSDRYSERRWTPKLQFKKQFNKEQEDKKRKKAAALRAEIDALLGVHGSEKQKQKQKQDFQLCPLSADITFETRFQS